jgi:hypothetical protein|nr:MAG TPA: hypothetical protein [Caudoviricetes sp.]
MGVIKKFSGRVRWFVGIGKKFRSFKIELMFDNPFAIRKELFIFEIVLLYITI